MKPFVILVSGGSASGKTTIVDEILNETKIKDCIIIKHDDYYKDQKDVPFEQRVLVNYDHPQSLDNDLLVDHLKSLISGESILKPIYSFSKYTRSDETELIEPKKVIIVEGILVLECEKLRELADLKIFVDSDDDTRLIRRIRRDIIERNRNLDSVIKQYLDTVKPMYHKYIRPSKRYADVIIMNDLKHIAAVKLVSGSIKNYIGEANE
jgi:uridine kinase